MLDAINRFKLSIIALKGRAIGDLYTVGFIDNNDGYFKPSFASVIQPYPVVDDGTDLTDSQTAAEATPAEWTIGSTPAVIDTTTRTVYRYSGGSWTGNTTEYPQLMKPGRMYLNPLTRKLFHVSGDNTARRFKTSA